MTGRQTGNDGLQEILRPDFHVRIHLQDLGDHLFGRGAVGADVHEAIASVVQEEGAETALLALLVGGILELGNLERVLLHTAVRNGVGLLVDGDGQQLVLPIEESPIEEEETRRIEENQDTFVTECLEQIQKDTDQTDDERDDRRPLDEPRTGGIGIDRFHTTNR